MKVPTTSESSTAALTALTPIVWGTTYVVATELLPEGRPMLAAAVRALPVGVAFILWSRRLPSGIWWWRAAILGLLNIAAFFALLFVAAFRLPGGVAATAGAIQPLVAAAIAAVVLGEAFTRRTAVAGAAGLAGVALLVLQPGAGLDPIGIVAAIAGTISMAAGVVLTKHWGRPVDLITFTGWQLTAGGLMLVPVAAITEGVPPSLTATNVAGFAWLAIIGTGLAYANWFRGVQALPVAVTGFLGLLSPLVATIGGWAILDQNLNSPQLTGAALVMVAVITPHLPRRPTKVNRLRPNGLSNLWGGGRGLPFATGALLVARGRLRRRRAVSGPRVPGNQSERTGEFGRGGALAQTHREVLGQVLGKDAGRISRLERRPEAVRAELDGLQITDQGHGTQPELRARQPAPPRDLHRHRR